MADYDGPERREYCVSHCQLNETAKRAVPRWAFLSALTAMIAMSVAFVGVNETRLTTLKMESVESIKRTETSLERRLSDDRTRYAEDVRRFYVLAERNGNLLDEVKTNQTEIKAKQDLVLRKINMSD